GVETLAPISELELENALQYEADVTLVTPLVLDQLARQFQQAHALAIALEDLLPCAGRDRGPIELRESEVIPRFSCHRWARSYGRDAPTDRTVPRRRDPEPAPRLAELFPLDAPSWRSRLRGRNRCVESAPSPA